MGRDPSGSEQTAVYARLLSPGAHHDRSAATNDGGTMNTTATLLTDHPAWTAQPDGTAIRLVATDAGAWYLVWDGADLTATALDGTAAPAPAAVETRAADLPPRAPYPLTEALAGLGTVHRLPSATLWEAITSGLLRRIIRAPQARALYQRWATTYGPTRTTAAGPMHTVPSPRAVLDLSEAQFTVIGAALHRKALPAAAAAYLTNGDLWAELPADDLVKALQEVPGIGPWTAACAAADFTGDYSVYPHNDLAVRTWAAKAAPDVQFSESPRGFEAAWCRWAPDRPQLHALTTYTLAWGIHARPVTGRL
jgi:DNA-3-methyladenine glycosylase II